jgi:hypothetical protein
MRRLNAENITIIIFNLLLYLTIFKFEKPLSVTMRPKRMKNKKIMKKKK